MNGLLMRQSFTGSVWGVSLLKLLENCGWWIVEAVGFVRVSDGFTVVLPRYVAKFYLC